jgi:glycosyltransferase involved in cell wall biosynthesis
MARIAHLTASLSRDAGGLHYGVSRLAQAVSQEWAEPAEVLGLEDGHTRQDLGAWAPLRVRSFAGRGPRAWGYSPGLRQALLGSGYGLLHSHGLWMYPSYAALQWTRLTRGPHLVSPHGMLDPWALKQSAWKKGLATALVEREHLLRAACLHSLCASETRSMRAWGLRQPICQIPNGVDLPGDEEAGPPPWGDQVGVGQRVLLSLGRLHPKKGLPALIAAFGRIKPAGWVLALAGWDQGGHEALLKDLARSRGLEGRVLFLGPLFGPAKAAAFRGASAFALPSHSEGLPVAVLEAWSYGLPVLMTEACNLEEGFSHGAALKVEPHADDLERALKVLFSADPALLKAVGARGRELVRERFTWKKVGQDMAAVYRWLLEGGARPACVRP